MKLADFNDASVPDALSWVAEGCYWIVSHPMEENINSPKEMNAVSTKGPLLFFPPVCPFAPSMFSQVTPRHVLHS
jgi:hypothetical protein